MVVSGTGFLFTGAGSITGPGTLTLESGATLTVQNANSFTGGSVLSENSVLTLELYNGVGSASTGESALGRISGSGQLVLSLQNSSSPASIQGNSLQDFTGVLSIVQGNIGLGRSPGHTGPGSKAVLGASRVDVGGNGAFIVSLGGGTAAHDTGNYFNSNVRTSNGALIGNRDGHVNWLGNVYLNVLDFSAETPQYDSAGVTEMGMYYGKYVVWNGLVAGDGVLRLTSGISDTGTDHRLVLTNTDNSFQGTYQVSGAYLTTLALAGDSVAADAGVELTTDNSRLVLLSGAPVIGSLNGAAGSVQSEGSGTVQLTVAEGDFNGLIRDSATSVAGLHLGVTKTGVGTLVLNGAGCTYTGATLVQGGVLHFNGDTTLGDISVSDSSARLEVSGNLTLRDGSMLSCDLSGAAGALIEVSGAVAASACGVQITGYESLSLGRYELLSWSGASSVSPADFTALGLTDTSDLIYSVDVHNNALSLVVGSMDSVPWLWSGGSAVWTDDSAAEWSNATSAGPAGQQVCFSVRDAGTVTIDNVTPAGISVNGGDYTFVAASDGSQGIVSSGTLRISGADTILRMNLNNPGFSGITSLDGGVLELGAAGALGASAIQFNGGLLRYGNGISEDVSSRISPASLSTVRVDTNGNDVSWGDAKALSLGIEKTGEGSLTLNWTAAGESREGDIKVSKGGLNINKTSGNGTLTGTFTGTAEIALSSPAGQLTVSGDNSAFGGTLALVGDGSSSGGSISFSSGKSIGGADTLVRVAGQRFWFGTGTTTDAAFEIVEGTSTYFDGSTGRAYTFTGSISGEGSLLVKPSCHITMSGDVSSFTGQFVHPGATSVSWLFGGAGVAGEGLVQANLDSSGSSMTYVFQYSAPTVMSGVVSGRASLRQQGEGVLTLTAVNTSTGNLVIDDACEIRLGTADNAAVWAGTSQLGTGRLTLVNGALSSPLTTQEGTVAAVVAAGAEFDMAGSAASSLQSISVDAGGLLRGMSGNLVIGGTTGVESLNLILADSNVGFTPVRADGKSYMLGIDEGTLQIADAASVTLDMEGIKDILSGQRQAVYLYLTNADIELQNGISAADLFASSSTSPEALGLVVLGVDGGSIVLEGAVREVYMVMENGDYDTVTSYTRLQDYMATFVDTGYTLSLNLPGDNTQQAWVNNLMGSGNFSVTNTEESSGVVRVLLNNEALVNPDATANTSIEGNISAGSAVQLVKTGAGMLTVGGALSADWLEVEEGSLRLSGSGSSVNTLHGAGAILLDGELEITGNSLAYSGNLDGAGTLILNGTLNGAGSVGSLEGNGALVASGAEFSVRNLSDSTFSGSLKEGEGMGVLTVGSGGSSFTLQRVNASDSWSVSNKGNMILNQSGGDSNAVLTLSRLELLDGSDSLIVINTDVDTGVFSLGSLQVSDAAQVSLQSTGNLLMESDVLELGVVGDADLGSDGRVPLTLGSGTAFQGVDSAWLSVEDGRLLLNLLRNSANQYAVNARSENARAGAGMLWQVPNSVLRESPDLLALTHGLDALVEQGRDGELDSVLAAAAGAGAAVLGSSVMNDMERQLRSIRNRTTSMGLDSQIDCENLPIFNAWVNAEGDWRELRSDGTAAGYTLSSWGATVGADIDFSPTVTAGLALTGMHGDMDAKSPDHAGGDVDSCYLSMLGRYTRQRWTHTLVGAFGWSDISLKRHVRFDDGGYSTRGSTSATSFGLLYELGYVIPLDEDNQACLQPVAGISYRHAQVDSYTERGSDAALHFGKQRMDTVSFALGARAQAYALENAFNRSALLEGRVLLKLDAGDRRSRAGVELNASRSRSGRVHAAEEGCVGMEMGAGITIPLGVDAGWLFLDGGFEFRAEESNWNGTVGYRLTF